MQRRLTYQPLPKQDRLLVVFASIGNGPLEFTWIDVKALLPRDYNSLVAYAHAIKPPAGFELLGIRNDTSSCWIYS